VAVTSRGLSTVVDATLCLLLVSASVLTLVTAVPDGEAEKPDGARRGLELLGSTTAAVEYRAPSPPRNRTARGTVVALLADAAAVRGRDASIRGFVPAVVNATERATRRVRGRVNVTVRWHPHDGGDAAGRVTVGASPPPAADVNAARLTVPVANAADEPARGTAVVVVRTWSA
jgi:hypothetical protein